MRAKESHHTAGWAEALSNKAAARQTAVQTNGPTHGRTDGSTGQVGRQADIQTDRQADTQTRRRPVGRSVWWHRRRDRQTEEHSRQRLARTNGRL